MNNLVRVRDFIFEYITVHLYVSGMQQECTYNSYVKQLQGSAHFVTFFDNFAIFHSICLFSSEMGFLDNEDNLQN